MTFTVKDIPYKTIEGEIKEGDPYIKWSGGEWKFSIATKFDVKLMGELWNETTYKKVEVI